ncbi:MAG: stage II sporulation protein R [Candidatus Gallimonas sp.]
MKKICVIVLLIAGIVGICFGFSGSGKEGEAAYLRVHIRANSNSEEDQAVKYKVRDKIVEFLTPTVAECETKEEAMERIGEKLGEASEVAEGVLRENGFYYGARASLRKEEFPTRVYENVTLNAGVYDALIVELGSGKGDNWWCVVYPPLCFGGGNVNIVYKSKIAEIVRNFFNR